MPLFEYRCRECNHEFELLVRGGTVPACSACGSVDLEKILSMFAVSSDGIQLRNRQTLGTQQRATSAANRKEQEHYRHDHHDD